MLNDYLILSIESFWHFLGFMYSGGYVLWCIFFLNIILWTLILERHWFFHRVFPQQARLTIKDWRKRQDFQSWQAQSIRAMIISTMKARLNRHLNSINSFVQLLPILGLLGTVMGMIETFDVLNLYGTGNARALAASISKALITTLAGLMSAIPGLFLSSMLQQQAEKNIDTLSDQLSKEKRVEHGA